MHVQQFSACLRESIESPRACDCVSEEPSTASARAVHRLTPLIFPDHRRGKTIHRRGTREWVLQEPLGGGGKCDSRRKLPQARHAAGGICGARNNAKSIRIVFENEIKITKIHVHAIAHLQNKMFLLPRIYRSDFVANNRRRAVPTQA
jgi:hypothetical protein